MQILKVLSRIINDSREVNIVENFFIWFANSIPDLYILKVPKSICLILAGVKTEIDSIYFKSSIAIDAPKQLEMGKGVFLNRGVVFEGRGRVIIGDGCHIGPNVVFATTCHDINNTMSVATGDIRIMNNVWIGANSVILKDVRLGPNVIVAAGAVVNKSFENCLVGGVPAKLLR